MSGFSSNGAHCARLFKLYSMSIETTIYRAAMAQGLPDTLARLLIAQAKHETGNFTSNFFKKYNNAFGYSYYPGSPWQVPGGGTLADNNQPIAVYKSVQDSVGEIADWLKRRVKEGKFPALSTITDPEQYAQLLWHAGYYTDTIKNYSRGLKAFFENLGELAVDNKGMIFVTMLVLAGVTYYLYKDK